MMSEHHQKPQPLVQNVGDFQLHPYNHHPDNRRLMMMAEHHQPQPPLVHNDLALPPGFKFLPTDLELIEFFFKPKLQNLLFPPEFKRPFLDVELYKHNPEELIGMHEKMEEDQENFYFFTPRERKYQNGSRPRRTANGGYWKATGKDAPIFNNDGGVVGYRKALDFCRGKQYGEGDRSEWKMHEYLTKEQKDHPNLPRTSQNPTKLNDWVLCKIYKTRRGTKRKDHAEEEPGEKRRKDHPEEKTEFDRIIDALLQADDSIFKREDFWMPMYNNVQ